MHHFIQLLHFCPKPLISRMGQEIPNKPYQRPFLYPILISTQTSFLLLHSSISSTIIREVSIICLFATQKLIKNL